MIRFLCHVGAGRDLERAYVRALRDYSGHTVRVVPINFADYGHAGMLEWSEFLPELHLHEMPVDGGGNLLPFVNVVCTERDTDLLERYTLGVPNLAVVQGAVEAFSILQQYDFVLAQEPDDARRLVDANVRAAVVTPDQAEALAMIVNELSAREKTT